MAVPSLKDASAILAARRALRGTDLDGVYLDHFVQVLCRLEFGRHGFRAADLAVVEAAWSGPDGVEWSGGFVARLKDGRRVHADGRSGQSHWSDDADIDAASLEPGQSLPELSARHGWQDHEWNDGIARGLNALIARHTENGLPI